MKKKTNKSPKKTLDFKALYYELLSVINNEDIDKYGSEIARRRKSKLKALLYPFSM
jgi:rubrerythrin